jgi:hypothetical protein
MVLNSFKYQRKLKKGHTRGKYGSHDLKYCTTVMTLPKFGIYPKKLVEEGYVMFEDGCV